MLLTCILSFPSVLPNGLPLSLLCVLLSSLVARWTFLSVVEIPQHLALPKTQRSLLTLTSDGDVVTEVTGLAIDLNAVVEVLLESGGIEDTVVSGTGEVDEELVGGLALLGASLSVLGNSL